MGKITQELIESTALKLSASWTKEVKGQTKPFFLLIGGLQGSGKSTLVANLRKTLNFAAIWSDEIRQSFFDAKVPFSEDFPGAVEKVRDLMLRRAFDNYYCVVLDENATEKRILHIVSLLGPKVIHDYAVCAVLLTASQEELEKRLGERPEIERAYKGTLAELRKSIKTHGDINLDSYKLVIDTESMTAPKIVETVKEFILSKTAN